MTATAILVVSNVILWVLVLFLFVVVLLIYKQVGELIIDRGTAPMHDEQGPAAGEPVPTLKAFDLETGNAVERQPRSEVLVFAFPGCPGCGQIAETLPLLARHRPEIGVTLLSVFSERDLQQSPDGLGGVAEIILPDALHSPESRAGLSVLVAPASDEDSPHNRFGVTATPFAIVVDNDGRVVAKAMLRSPEHLPRLLATDEDDEVDVEQPSVDEVGRSRVHEIGR
ncbi:MAG: hypothetical protein M3323_15620 [Actinomycetota bacterium]|nr:hypothetical protein [Actinomycetota bacterium]